MAKRRVAARVGVVDAAGVRVIGTPAGAALAPVASRTLVVSEVCGVATLSGPPMTVGPPSAAALTVMVVSWRSPPVFRLDGSRRIFVKRKTRRPSPGGSIGMLDQTSVFEVAPAAPS